MWRSPFFTQPKCRSANSSSEEGEDVCGVAAVLYENYSQLQDTRTLDIHLMPLPILFPPLFFLAPAMELSGLLTPYNIILCTKLSGNNAQMVGNHLWHTGVLFECFFSTRQKRLTMSFNQLALSKNITAEAFSPFFRLIGLCTRSRRHRVVCFTRYSQGRSQEWQT